MASTAAEKTEEVLKREIDELHQQQREINERLRDPRGLRRGGLATNGPLRNLGVNGGSAPRQRGFIRPADRFDSDDQPAPKRRLLSAVVKVKDGEATEDIPGGAQNGKEDSAEHNSNAIASEHVRKSSGLRQQHDFRRGGRTQRFRTDGSDTTKEDALKILSKDTNPSLFNRNRRMLGSLLGTLEKFQKEDKQLSSTEAYMRRSDSLQRAEQRAREESEKLRQQEREKIAENRRRDLTLRARVSAKAEEKKLELLFLRWSEHHNKLGNYLRTKTEPQIYYMPSKPFKEEDPTVAEQRKEKAFQEWKTARREEISEYQKQIEEQYLANVESELERWQNTRRTGNNNNSNSLQETMDKELETHQLEHGPKTTRKVVEDEEDVEDINVGEDDIMDDVLVIDDNNAAAAITMAATRVDDSTKPDEGSPDLVDI